MIDVALAALLAATAQPSFRELRCTGVPQFPGGKKVFLSSKQIVWSAAAPDVVTFVEPDAMVGIFHYEMRRVSPKLLKGTATLILTSDWAHRSAPVTCKIIR
jgi:hypothetical protein